MEDSGAILCHLSSLKDMLDQVNEEIEANIQSTREIESEMVKCSEIEKGLLVRELELTKMIYMGEFDMNGLIQVAAVARTSLELMEKELSCLRMNREETLKRMNNNCEKFLVQCKSFQNDIVSGENEELSKLLSEKEVLENEFLNLNTKIIALRNSTSAFVEEILEELRSSNSVLQVEVQSRNSENHILIEDINDLKASLLAIHAFGDHPCLSQEEAFVGHFGTKSN